MIGEMRIVYISLFAVLLLGLILPGVNDLHADQNSGRWSIHGTVGLRQPTFNEKFQPWAMSPTFDMRLYYRVNDKLLIGGLFSYSRVFNDSSSTSTFKIGNGKANQYWNNSSIGVLAKVRVYSERTFAPFMQFGIGVSSWSINWKATDEAVIVEKPDGSDTEYEASEIFLMAGLGGESFIHPRWSINYGIELILLTGIGTDFSDNTNSYRSQGYANLKVGLGFYFGGREKSVFEKWREEERLRSQVEGVEAADTAEVAVGVTDIGEADSVESTADSDADGVRDAIDLCPDTPAEAAELVDETGCPIDSDIDGVPDYLDQCVDTPVGYAVDSVGCPRDGDSDGIADERDKCPETPRGYPVDSDGCFDKASLFSKRIIYASYQPGGSTIDEKTAAYLDSLVLVLTEFKDVKANIYGYTDNIGEAQANLKLSQKRADRVRNFLISRGIEANRLNSIGRGETNFIATNANKYGREKNRRIEIEFEY